jgi:pentalenic acid synthase
MSGRRADLVTQRRVLNLALQTLVAGNESTLSVVAMGLLSLLAHRNQWDALVAEPARVPAAVEELLRYLSVADSVPRVALAEVEIAGEVIRAGDGVLLATPAANRDGRTFADPDQLDIGRSARHHVAFGYGVHQCVGQNLARATLEIALGTLVTRVPGLRLAVPADEVLIDGGVGVHRITRLPVRWDVR